MYIYVYLYIAPPHAHCVVPCHLLDDDEPLCLRYIHVPYMGVCALCVCVHSAWH